MLGLLKPRHRRPGRCSRRDLLLKAEVRRSFNNHDGSGTASQVTPHKGATDANATGGKGEFELATDGRDDPVLYLWDTKTSLLS